MLKTANLALVDRTSYSFLPQGIERQIEVYRELQYIRKGGDDQGAVKEANETYLRKLCVLKSVPFHVHISSAYTLAWIGTCLGAFLLWKWIAVAFFIAKEDVA